MGWFLVFIPNVYAPKMWKSRLPQQCFKFSGKHSLEADKI